MDVMPHFSTTNRNTSKKLRQAISDGMRNFHLICMEANSFFVSFSMMITSVHAIEPFV